MSRLARQVAWVAAIVLGVQFLGALAIQLLMSNTVRVQFVRQLTRGLEDSGSLRGCVERPGPWKNADGWWSAWPVADDGHLVGEELPVEQVSLPELDQSVPWAEDGRIGTVYRSASEDCGGVLLVQEHPYPVVATESGRIGLLVALRIMLVPLAGVALVLLTAVPVVRRIQALSAKMGSVVTDNFVGTVADGANDELGEVGRAFDAATAIARERLQRLEHRDELLRRALADLAHDLRTPLATLKLSASGLSASAAATTIRAELAFLEGMTQNFEALLVSDEDGEVEQVALDQLLERVQHRFAPLATDRQLSFDVGLPDEALFIEAESVALERAIGNLIQNAMRFARGHVVLLLFRDNAEIRIEVRDDGPGFGDISERAAERGVRGHRAQAEGFGLGLAIAEACARRFGGRLSLDESSGGETLVAMIFPSPADA